MNERSHYIRLGKRPSKYGDRRAHREHRYDSYWTMPSSKFWKRQANKRVRKSLCVNGNYYKKCFDSFEWS